MIYTLQDLLVKMGAPEVKEKGRIEWHFFDPEKKDISGRAEIRLEHGGDRLIAELQRTHANYEDDNGEAHPTYTDTFYMSAERTARPGHYRITRLSFDGEEYDKPKKAVIELGLSMFHAKALDISVTMVEQAFHKSDILDRAPEPRVAVKKYFTQKREAPKKAPAPTGVVIPFRPRDNRATA